MKQIGDYGELCFLKEATARGYRVSIPFGEDASYDFILDSGYELFKVQVKTTAAKVKDKDAYKFITARGSNYKIPYTKVEVDAIACVILPQEIFYIFPISFLHKKLTVRVYPNNNESINNPFKENWELFEKKLEEVSF